MMCSVGAALVVEFDAEFASWDTLSAGCALNLLQRMTTETKDRKSLKQTVCGFLAFAMSRNSLVKFYSHDH